ncbi:protein goliath [Folsomia candida]|uniref:protein goliath n=1 Tax=Folsomia candida TaxID=158441 RepID=UPI000B8F4171|nr:protein goliath [Folsomia candida]XP_021954981.1 protein goliath [Folsomia candida]XP_021954982.1 protein goliath [Folsomia candida]XP_021954983.1 protein goliath [Folsomia candida]XP_035709182.1 protein goliath [Folsomia candida]XP_035709183.1 protein goliath [Folsomia candida]
MEVTQKILKTVIILFMLQHDVESVVASEWSLAGPADEYVMAVINITYINPLTGKQKHPEYQGAEIGKFGMGKVGPAVGTVVHVRSRRTADGKVNHYGCEPLDGPFPDRPWIALIKRGNCNFDRKLENAQARNAVAMLVYDLEDRDTLEKMGLSNCRNCSIPGVFTYKRIGEEIANVSDSGILVEMIITVGETCTRPYSGINRTSVLFVSISFIVLMIISLAWLVFYYVQRFRYLHAKDRLAQRLCNAAKKALAKIPTRNVKLTDKEIAGEAECCAVCIEFYASGDVLRTLPCRHEFHKGCVDPWLLEHRTCPMCKMDILKYYGFIFTGSQESILHLDLEDGNLNSSDSRDTDTPTHNHQTHQVRYAEPADTRNMSDNPQSSNSSCPSRQQQQNQTGDAAIRKPSLISLTVVATECDGPISPISGKSGYAYDCKCRCLCDKATSTRLSDVQHPVCYVHEEAEIESHHSLEDSSSEMSGVAASHQPLIHREDSGLAHQINANPHHQVDSNYKSLSTNSGEELHHPDFIAADSQNSASPDEMTTPPPTATP